jgi:hypothetical protein
VVALTIVVGAASPDGIVLGADSRTTYLQGDRHRISSDAADKVFELGEQFGVATYGGAFIGYQTINGLMDEFVANVDDESVADIETFSTALGEFFNERFIAEYGEPGGGAGQGWEIGFVVAGYQAGIGHVREVGVPGPIILDTGVTTAQGGALWRGQTDVIARLIKGYDGSALEQAGKDLPQEARDELAQLEYIVLHPTTLQDAADMVSFLVRTTIDMQRFSDGTALSPGLVPGCGGQTQLLAVTRSGVEWISKRWLVGPSRPGWAEGSMEQGY